MNELQNIQELIKVNTETETPTISGRELHAFLEVETPYHKWFPRMCEYGFIENQDYMVTDIFVPNSNGGKQTQIDHALNINMAKEICMIQRSEKGKMARQYFLEIEKRWNDPVMTMARALKFADKRIVELSTKITADAPKVAFANALSASGKTMLIRDFVKYLYQNGYETGEKRFYEFLRQNHYLIEYGESRNTPTQRAMELGLFNVQSSAITYPDGRQAVKSTTKLTPKGQQYFINRLVGNRNIKTA